MAGQSQGVKELNVHRKIRKMGRDKWVCYYGVDRIGVLAARMKYKTAWVKDF